MLLFDLPFHPLLENFATSRVQMPSSDWNVYNFSLYCHPQSTSRTLESYYIILSVFTPLVDTIHFQNEDYVIYSSVIKINGRRMNLLTLVARHIKCSTHGHLNR